MNTGLSSELGFSGALAVPPAPPPTPLIIGLWRFFEEKCGWLLWWLRTFGGSLRDVTIYQLEQKWSNIVTTCTIILMHSNRMPALRKKIFGEWVINSKLFNVTGTLNGLVCGCSFKPQLLKSIKLMKLIKPIVSYVAIVGGKQSY